MKLYLLTNNDYNKQFYVVANSKAGAMLYFTLHFITGVDYGDWRYFPFNSEEMIPWRDIYRALTNNPKMDISDLFLPYGYQLEEHEPGIVLTTENS